MTKPGDLVSVRDLLARSRGLHQQYRAHQPRLEGARLVTGDTLLARQALTQARDLRVQAGAQDPTHADAAWQDDDDATMMAFYREMLSRV